MADTTPPDSETIPEEDPTPVEEEASPGTPVYRSGLVRTRENRVIAGVAAGLAEAWGARLWLVRAGFIVSSAFAGLGLVLYALGWLLMPEEGEPESIAQRIVRRMNVQPTWVGFVLLMAGALILAGLAGISGGVLVAAGLLVGGYVLYRGDFALPDVVAAPAGDADTDSPPPAYVYQRTVRPPRPPRPRSYLGRLTVGAMLVTLGIMGSLDALDLTSPTTRHYAAAAVLIIGGGLLVGTVYGRSRGLIFLGILLLPLLAVAAITDFRFGTRFDNIDLRLTSVEEIEPSYTIEAGELYLDLTAVDFQGEMVTLDLDVGVGNINVQVPRTVDVQATAATRLGEANVLGQWSSGLGAAVERTVDGLGDDGGALIVDATTRMGSISIWRDEGLRVFRDGASHIFEEWSYIGDDAEIDAYLDGLRADGRVFEMGLDSAGLAARSAGDVADAYLMGGGSLFLDLSDIPEGQEVSTVFAGEGEAIVLVSSDAAVTVTSHTPIEGLDGSRGFFDEGIYRYERDGFGPRILIEGYGPRITVEQR